jgi:hypothetical protein
MTILFTMYFLGYLSTVGYGSLADTIGGENERKSLTGCEGMEVDMPNSMCGDTEGIHRHLLCPIFQPLSQH